MNLVSDGLQRFCPELLRLLSLYKADIIIVGEKVKMQQAFLILQPEKNKSDPWNH